MGKVKSSAKVWIKAQNQCGNDAGRRVLSVFFAVILFLQTIFSGIGIDSVFAEDGKNRGIVLIRGMAAEYEQTLQAVGSGGLLFTAKIKAQQSVKDISTDSRVSKTGYFTAGQSGEYLIELWGGTGAAGGDTSYSGGGSGGSGGYIYGTIALEKGETLYYTLGGNGEQTASDEEGGGANGTGGNHGSVGSYTVGGGGGYSAVFCFSPGEFEEKYLNADGQLLTETIDEKDRVSKYIMIAGGGGGGGAGNGFSFGGSASGTPDGGAGGNFSSGYGVLSGASYDVNGTFFAGSDGRSSGTSSAYVGRGGSYVPGTAGGTQTGLFETDQANDWKGTYNSSAQGGAGGAGNLRGGGGGAGFCGGSGGIMTGILSPDNIGGGGGGSSFLSDRVTYQGIDEKTEARRNGVHESEAGGAVHICFLGQQDQEALSDLRISGTISRYFDIASVYVNRGTAVRSDTGFSVTGTSILPDEEGNGLILYLGLTPKSGFAGGNRIPIFENRSLSLTMEDGTEEAVIPIAENCAFANIELNFEVIAHSYVTNEEGKSYAVTELYQDNYAEVRDRLESDWRYDFIESIGPYTVSDQSGILPDDAYVTPLADVNRYPVAFTVVPKENGEAVVGTVQQARTFAKDAVITLLDPGEALLNGNEIAYSKNLQFDEAEEEYILSLDIKANSEGIAMSIPEPMRDVYGSGTGIFEILHSGYYLIQTWGGNGGAGGSGGVVLVGTGGAGGTGGFVSGYLFLEKGDVLICESGADGTDGRGGGLFSSGGGGEGGSCTTVQIEKAGGQAQYLLIAAGGGGGAGGIAGGTAGQAGESVDNDQVITQLGNSSAAALCGGTSGKTGANSGNAGVNFRDPNVLTDTDSLTEAGKNRYQEAQRDLYGHTAGGGAVYITCLELEEDTSDVSDATIEQLQNFELSAQIAEYFDVVRVFGEGCTLESAGTGQTVSAVRIVPEVTTSAAVNEAGHTVIAAEAKFAVKIALAPKEGFLGGNDVPVLMAGSQQCPTGMNLSQRGADIDIPEHNRTDFANVEIPYAPDPDTLTVYEKTYISGDPGIPENSLFTAEAVPQPTNDWRDAFVSVQNPFSERIHTPSLTTSYPITVGIVPKAAAEKAICRDSVTGKAVTKDAKISVIFEVLYELSYAETTDTPDENGRYTVDADRDYAAGLRAERGYELPEEIEVSIGETPLSSEEYTYDPVSGELKIPKEKITATVRIQAEAVPRKHTVHYFYESSPGGDTQVTEEQYQAGAVISRSFVLGYTPAEYEGYFFEWEWSTEDKSMPSVMPGNDLWVTGSYKPFRYRMTIHYYYEGTTENVFDPVEKELDYGSAYTVESPVKSGYLADQPVVSGVLTADTEIEVFYKATANELNIIYIREDSGEVVSSHQSTAATGESYRVETPKLPGYTPDLEEVSGTMDADGVTVYVRYFPNRYRVALDANGGICNVSSRTVIFNDLYGRLETGEYDSLPTPFRVGYEFDGWYLNGRRITEESSVTTAEDHTLQARWTELKFSVTVQYVFEDGTEAAQPVSGLYAYGAIYEFISPQLEGYTADLLEVSGRVPAQNTVITVTYKANEYLLTIRFLYADSGENAAEDVVRRVAYGAAYEEIPPAIDGFYASTDVISGTMPKENKEIIVYYYKNQPVISVTVEWGNLVFDYDHGSWQPDTHTYTENPILPEGQNLVRVINQEESTVSVNAEFLYLPAASCGGVRGYVTEENDRSASKLEQEVHIPIGGSGEVWLWLEGALPRNAAGTIVSGECRVTIKGGE